MPLESGDNKWRGNCHGMKYAEMDEVEKEKSRRVDVAVSRCCCHRRAQTAGKTLHDSPLSRDRSLVRTKDVMDLPFLPPLVGRLRLPQFSLARQNSLGTLDGTFAQSVSSLLKNFTPSSKRASLCSLYHSGRGFSGNEWPVAYRPPHKVGASARQQGFHPSLSHESLIRVWLLERHAPRPPVSPGPR